MGEAVSGTLVLDEEGSGKDYRHACLGPDIDHIIRERYKNYLRESKREIRDVALTLRMPEQELRDWLDGAPGKIDLLSKTMAVSGIENLAEFLGWHDGEEPEATPQMIRDGILRRVTTTLSDDDMRLLLKSLQLLQEVPELRHVINRGYKDMIDYAQAFGIDTRKHEEQLRRSMFGDQEKKASRG